MMRGNAPCYLGFSLVTERQNQGGFVFETARQKIDVVILWESHGDECNEFTEADRSRGCSNLFSCGSCRCGGASLNRSPV